MKRYNKKYIVVISLLIAILIYFLIAPEIQAISIGDGVEAGDVFLKDRFIWFKHF